MVPNWTLSAQEVEDAGRKLLSHLFEGGMGAGAKDDLNDFSDSAADAGLLKLIAIDELRQRRS